MLEVILKTISEFETQDMSDKMSDNEKSFFAAIYPYLEENQEIGNAKAVELSGRPQATVRRYLAKLVSLAVLTTTGENRNRKYRLK